MAILAQIKRRRFLALLGSMATISRPAGAQQWPKKIPRIGIIDDGPIWQPFRDALREAGYVEGRSIAFETRAANGDPARLATAAAELARLRVDIIMTYGTPPSRAAKAATSTIPIVMIAVGAPVLAGLVQSLAHPGGNITGNTIVSTDLAPKRLQLIKEILPSASRVALLWNPDNVSNGMILQHFLAAAPAQGLAFTAVEARTPGDFEDAYAILARERPDAVLLTSDPIHHSQLSRTVEFLKQNKLPGMFQTRDDVEAGGLMSYGAIFAELFAQGAFFVQKILNGTRPADIPVQTPQRFELVVNLKTAKEIGVTISDAVMLRADGVIE